MAITANRSFMYARTIHCNISHSPIFFTKSRWCYRRHFIPFDKMSTTTSRAIIINNFPIKWKYLWILWWCNCNELTIFVFHCFYLSRIDSNSGHTNYYFIQYQIIYTCRLPMQMHLHLFYNTEKKNNSRTILDYLFIGVGLDVFLSSSVDSFVLIAFLYLYSMIRY